MPPSSPPSISSLSQRNPRASLNFQVFQSLRGSAKRDCKLSRHRKPESRLSFRPKRRTRRGRRRAIHRDRRTGAGSIGREWLGGRGRASPRPRPARATRARRQSCRTRRQSATQGRRGGCLCSIRRGGAILMGPPERAHAGVMPFARRVHRTEIRQARP